MTIDGIDLTALGRALDYSADVAVAATSAHVETIDGVDYSVTELPTADRWLVKGYHTQLTRGSASRRHRAKLTAGYMRELADPSPMRAYLEGERDVRRKAHRRSVLSRIALSPTPALIL